MVAVLRSWRQSYALIFVATVALVAAADYLIYRSTTLGWAAAIVAVAMLLLLALRNAAFFTLPGGRVTWLASVGLLAALVEQPTRLNVLYMLLCLSVLALINAHGWDSDFARWLRRWARWALTGWTRLFLDNGVAVRWLLRRGFSPTLARGLAAWVIPCCLAAVFVVMFAWANPIISGWFARLGTWIEGAVVDLPEFLAPARVMFWLLIAVVAWSLMRVRGRRPRRVPHTAADEAEATARQHHEAAAGGSGLGPPPGVVVRSLVLFNIVFVVQNALDSRFLFGGRGLPEGMTYPQYVHRGAYPLVAAALLAAAFVLLTFRPGSRTEASRWARRLVYLWITQTIFLTFTAAWRLVRYAEMTGLTRLRLASMIWFTLVALGLFYIVWRILRRRSNAWLINANAVTALLVLYACCFLNFDGMIARFNAWHCAEAGGRGSAVDVEYLAVLGTPALPALESVRDKIADAATRARAADISRQLRAELNLSLRDWRTWTWRRYRTARQTPAADDPPAPTAAAAPAEPRGMDSRRAPS